MTNPRGYLDRLRAEADEAILTHLGLGRSPRQELPDGSFTTALLPWEKAAVLGGMAASGADRRFDATLRGLTAGTLSDRELGALKDRALDAARREDIGTLAGIQEGVPVTVTPAQKAVIDRLVGRLGGDALGQKARSSYEGAVRGGRVKVR